jgi:hypothetical protein
VGCAWFGACFRLPAALPCSFGFGFDAPFASAGGPWNFCGIQ